LGDHGFVTPANEPGVTGGDDERMIDVGRFSGLYGVRGWLKVYSYTEPRENIIRYRPWYIRREGRWREVEIAEGRRHGKTVVVRLPHVTDRDQARALLGMNIAIRRGQLPPAAAGEYYWSDLVGLRVVTTTGTELGVIDHLIETGANDVISVLGERERLLPYDPGGVIADVDLERGVMTVDWDPDF